ncbi:MAG: glycosyltransferase [Gammaproteobacteria bacterium]|nr:glycosyltransferase [Gammaproteobacteria bacterium]
MQTTETATVSYLSAATQPVARLLFWDSGRGLRVDADLLQQRLERQGWRVIRELLPGWSVAKTQRSLRLARIKSLLPAGLVDLANTAQIRWGRRNKVAVDLQIHLETPAVDWIAASRVNWLIPNQEWVKPQHLCFFDHLDAVLCKSLAALTIFQAHHDNARFLGFSSPAVPMVNAVGDTHDRFRRFLHVAGRNRKKGAQAVVEAWRRHPEWPELQLVIDDVDMVAPVPANVRVWRDIDDEALADIRARNGVVLAPSEVEGFGHILLEGMLHGGFVVTTDAAPMNELVTRDRGMLLPWRSEQNWHLGTRYFVTPEAIEAAVEDVLQTSGALLAAKAKRARAWVLQNHWHFEQAFAHEVSGLALPASQRPRVV